MVSGGWGPGCCPRPRGAQDGPPTESNPAPVSEVLRTSRPDLARTLPEPDAVGGPSGPEEVRLQLVCLGLLCLTPPGFLCPELGTQRGRGMRAGAAQNLLEKCAGPALGWGGRGV